MFWPLVHIDHFVDRSAVDSHPQRDPRMFFQGSRNFQSALRRRFGICPENKRHPITSREPDQLSFGLGFAKFVRAANDFIKLAQQSALLVNEQFRVAYDVDEQDVPNLQTVLFFVRHLVSLPSCHARPPTSFFRRERGDPSRGRGTPAWQAI